MRLTKRQLKRIIREEYSRLKRRGLIREATGDERAGIGTAAENAVRRYLQMPEIIRHASSYAPEDVMDERSGGFGQIEVKGCASGTVSVELFEFDDIRTSDVQDLRTQIEGETGDLVGYCEQACDEYFSKFDNLICVRTKQGNELYLVPREALRLLPSAVYSYGIRKGDSSLRPSAKFKVMWDACVNLGTLDEAMSGEPPMMESRRRRTYRIRTSRY